MRAAWLLAVLLTIACASTVPSAPLDALIRIERTGADETDPATLYVPAGTGTLVVRR